VRIRDKFNSRGKYPECFWPLCKS